MQSKTTIIALLLMLSMMKVHALDMSAAGGYDTNPFELSGRTDGGLFTDLQIGHKGKHKVLKKSEIQYNAGLTGRIYENAFEDADYHKLDLRGRFIHRFKVGERSSSLMITADWRSDRRTYFSQRTRSIATSRGNSIADRFDYDSAKLAAEFTFRLNKQHSLSLYSYLSQRNYIEDYESFNLESLDFYEYAFQPTYRFKAKNGFYLRAFVYAKNRLYEDLLEDDLTGVNITDDKLDYMYYGYGTSATHKLTDKLSINGYLNGYFARDDADGFRDFDFHKLRLGFDYQIKDNRKISAQGSCYIRDFLLDVASPTESETGYAGRLKKGCKAEARYSAPFLKLDTNKLLWHAIIGTELDSNSDVSLSYDKHYAMFSISYTF